MSPRDLAGLFAGSALGAGLLAWALILWLRPWLTRLASAKPDFRSTHRVPTPQGAGIGVMIAASAVMVLAVSIVFGGVDRPLLGLLAGLAVATIAGAIDDMSGMGWRLKLVIQALACSMAIATLPDTFRLFAGALPFWLERGGALLWLIGLVNIVNFVDGIDEITAAHSTPALAACLLAASAAEIDGRAGLVAATLFGAVCAFWLWNRHPARIFLGDSGSLPLGLALGWLSLMLAERAPAAGLLVLAYPLTDGAWTLVRRLLKGDRITTPHREHAYQAATDTGLPHRQIIVTVAAIAGFGAVLALACLAWPTPLVQAASLALALVATALPLTAWLCRRSALS